jgi:diaminohydroxyphosphoribosylaminopyrimidine deaminase/5-amino-6-(5-phosphoribosylamino)uracil reductase
MRQALRLALRARGRTSPNPIVGAVVVRDGEVIGRGFHRRAGTAHAEVVALAQAGDRARGADLYVNLEPCNHTGRTGPCVECIVRAGIRRVAVGMRDPNPLVDGRGVRALRRAGVEVVEGVLEEECQRLNEAFACAITERRPFVILKTATTLDGHVATRSGDARWVSGEAARREGHRLRDACDAILVGVGTVLADDPSLDCRGVPAGRDPVRVVLDSRLRTPPGARVVALTASSPAPTLIVATPGAPVRRERALAAAGAEVMRLPADAGGRVSLPALLAWLHERELQSLLLEGGPTLAGAFFAARLVDRVVAFIAPKLLGDAGAKPVLAGPAVAKMSDAVALEGVELRRVGEDLMLSGRIPCRRDRRRRRA